MKVGKFSIVKTPKVCQDVDLGQGPLNLKLSRIIRVMAAILKRMQILKDFIEFSEPHLSSTTTTFDLQMWTYWTLFHDQIFFAKIFFIAFFSFL